MYTVAQMVFDNHMFGLSRLVREAKNARDAVIAHQNDRSKDPNSHRGCLWCEDGRLSHWLTDVARWDSGGALDANDHTAAISAVYTKL